MKIEKEYYEYVKKHIPNITVKLSISCLSPKYESYMKDKFDELDSYLRSINLKDDFD